MRALLLQLRELTLEERRLVGTHLLTGAEEVHGQLLLLLLRAAARRPLVVRLGVRGRRLGVLWRLRRRVYGRLLLLQNTLWRRM